MICRTRAYPESRQEMPYLLQSKPVGSLLPLEAGGSRGDNDRSSAFVPHAADLAASSSPDEPAWSGGTASVFCSFQTKPSPEIISWHMRRRLRTSSAILHLCTRVCLSLFPPVSSDQFLPGDLCTLFHHHLVQRSLPCSHLFPTNVR